MKVPAIILLTIAVLMLQITVAPRLGWHGACPDLIAILVVFVAMHSPAPRSLLDGALIGLACDCLSIERGGVFMLTYGVIGWLVASVRDYVFIYEIVTQSITTAIAAMLVQITLLSYRMLFYPETVPSFFGLLGTAFLVAAYTALLAPFFHLLMLRIHGLLGLPEPHYRVQGKY